jgi:pimeloyl-ACP methyl ester carboxylesterase
VERGSHQHWWQRVPAFAGRHRCITYDARGFGRSSGAPHVDGPDGHIDDLIAVLDSMQVDRALLIVHSMGGYAVSGMASRHPERVAGLVMVDTPFGIATVALARRAAEMMDSSLPVSMWYRPVRRRGSPRRRSTSCSCSTPSLG